LIKTGPGCPCPPPPQHTQPRTRRRQEGSQELPRGPREAREASGGPIRHRRRPPGVPRRPQEARGPRDAQGRFGPGEAPKCSSGRDVPTGPSQEAPACRTRRHEAPDFLQEGPRIEPRIFRERSPGPTPDFPEEKPRIESMSFRTKGPGPSPDFVNEGPLRGGASFEVKKLRGGETWLGLCDPPWKLSPSMAP
jgi:hypothetical protein